MAYYSKLTPSDSITTGDYGYSIAAGNGKIAVGAVSDDIGAITGAGSVYIYNVDGTGEVKISGSDIAGNNAAFGASVAIADNKLAVGATGVAQVYVYDLDGTNEVIINPSLGFSDSFGDAVAIHKGKLYVGAPGYDTGKGAVFIYSLSNLNSSPVELRPVNSSPISDELSFGDSISVGNNRIVIGAPGSNGGVGRTYVYDLSGQNEYTLNPSDQPSAASFGSVVDIGSNKIVVTAPADDVGSAYIYNLDGSNEVKISQASGSSQGSPLTDNYGTSLSIGSGKIAIGAHDFSGYPYSVGNASNGGAFVYDVSGLNEYYFYPADVASGDHFGYDLEIYDGFLIASSIYAPSIYVYELFPAGGTTVNNLSSSSYNGTLNGAVAIPGGVQYPTFNRAGYYDFNSANNQYIDTGLNAGSVTELTVEAWLRVDTYNNTGAGISIGDTATGTGECYLGLGNSGGDSIDWRFYTGTFLDETEFFTSDTGWKHYVGTYDQSGGAGSNQGRMRLYVDGNLEDTALSNNTSAINFAGGTNIRIGTNTDSSASTSFFDGKFGEVRIYTRALTAAEVLQNFNATRSKYGV